MSFNGHLTDYLSQHAKSSPNKLALVTDDKSLTWQELWQRVQAGAEYLNGQLPADSQAIVGLLLSNNWQYVVSYLSVIHAGHMALPIDVIYKELEIEAILRQVPPALVVSDEANHHRLDFTKTKVIKAEDLPGSTGSKETNYLRLDPKAQIACLLFTSGTTGSPKVVPNTHANHIWNIEACSKVWGWTAEDNQLISLRLSHMHGIVMGLAGMLYHGGTMHLHERFDARKTLETLASGKVSMFTHGPAVYQQLLVAAEDGEYDISKVRLLISGSGPLPPQVWHDFKQKFSQEILEVYGSSETGRIASNLLDERIPGSPGRPLSGVDLKFSKTNEVLVKSPGVCPGYYQNPEATKKSLSKDGYWQVGDIGELIGGRIILKGRTQERIRKLGYSISPRDIEWALHKNSKISDAVVMGAGAGDESDDKLVYFIVGDITKDEVIEFSKANLPSVWRADQIIMLDSLPRTRVGKPNLAELKAMVK